MEAGDNLDALLDGDRVHEVGGDDARRGTEIGWVLCERVRIERIGMTVQQQEDVGGSAACAGKAADAG